jgi:hypothetical protein
MWQEGVAAYFKALSQYLRAEIQAICDKTVRTVGKRNEISDHDHRNMTQEWYPLDSKVVLITLWTDLARPVPFGTQIIRH